MWCFGGYTCSHTHPTDSAALFRQINAGRRSAQRGLEPYAAGWSVWQRLAFAEVTALVLLSVTLMAGLCSHLVCPACRATYLFAFGSCSTLPQPVRLACCCLLRNSGLQVPALHGNTEPGWPPGGWSLRHRPSAALVWFGGIGTCCSSMRYGVRVVSALQRPGSSWRSCNCCNSCSLGGLGPCLSYIGGGTRDSSPM